MSALGLGMRGPQHRDSERDAVPERGVRTNRSNLMDHPVPECEGSPAQEGKPSQHCQHDHSGKQPDRGRTLLPDRLGFGRRVLQFDVGSGRPLGTIHLSLPL